MIDIESLLKEIERCPDDDILRLIYADKLDEDEANDPRRVKCVTCKGMKYVLPNASAFFVEREDCSVCNGTGEVLNTTRSARAELIRVQVERASLDDPVIHRLFQKDGPIPDPTVIRHAELGRRQELLLRQYESKFRRSPKCFWCDGIGTILGCAGDKYNPSCGKCFGTGDAGGLMEKCGPCQGKGTGFSDATKCVCCDGSGWHHKVEFVRGFPRVHCRMEECHTDERIRDGKQVSSDWLLSVVRHHPGVEMWVTDREAYRDFAPVDSIPNQTRETAYWEEGSGGANLIPLSILESMIGGFKMCRGPDYSPISLQRAYPNQNVAQLALARAIPQWVREHGRKA